MAERAAANELRAQTLPAGEVAWLTSPELAGWMVECLGQLGYAAELVEDPFGYGFDMNLEGKSKSFVEEFGEGVRKCEDDAVAEGKSQPPGYEKSEAEWQAEYDHRLEVKNCLEEAGYEIGPAPNLSDYVDGEGDWSAHQVVIDTLGPDLAEESFRECQQ